MLVKFISHAINVEPYLKTMIVKKETGIKKASFISLKKIYQSIEI